MLNLNFPNLWQLTCVLIMLIIMHGCISALKATPTLSLIGFTIRNLVFPHKTLGDKARFVGTDNFSLQNEFRQER